MSTGLGLVRHDETRSVPVTTFPVSLSDYGRSYETGESFRRVHGWKSLWVSTGYDPPVSYSPT